jgi:hypothetical protein
MHEMVSASLLIAMVIAPLFLTLKVSEDKHEV